MDARRIFQQLIARHTNELDGADEAALENAYARARAEAGDFLADQVEPFDPSLAVNLRLQFEEAVDEDRRLRATDSQHEPAVRNTPSRKPASFGLGVVCGIVLAGLVAAGVWFSGVVTGGAALSAPEQKLIERHRERQGVIAEAQTFLRVLEERVKVMQASNDPALRESEKTFLSLSKILPDMQKERPKSLAQVQLVLRADFEGYKILMAGALCNDVAALYPGLEDHKRTGPLGCTHFGLWNEAGKDW